MRRRLLARILSPSRRTAYAEAEEAEARALERTWGREPGLLGWITTTNHKEIGLRFVKTAFLFFLLGGVLALLMRTQLIRSRNTFLGPDIYNQLFTTHGTTMMFLFAVPVMEGMSLYLVPLMVGARSVAFPRLMNFGYYLYLIGGLMLYVALLLNVGPDMGWFSYVPLAGPDYSPGKRVDVWSQMVTMVEVSTLVGAIGIITTVFKMRAPGMSLTRIPMFVWAALVTALMIIFAMTSVMLCSTMLATDRHSKVNTHFFNPAEGGDPLLWQHMFWFFAHPELYIIFVPATGFISEILEAFCRRKVFGYIPLVLANVATAFIGFGVWVHHMFATPLPQLGQGLFTASSLMIVIPNGMHFFCWIATLCGGRISLKLPLVWVLGFFATFLIGGLTGVMLAAVSINRQVHDTFFVVAHLHYVLIGGAIFPLFGAFYYWYSKWTGRMLGERLGWWNFLLMFVGFHLTFFPMHLLGLKGMTCRVYSYAPETGWGPLNALATIGAFTLGLSVLLFLVNAARSRRRSRLAGDNPWGAHGLEWTISSPPPPYSYRRPPTVRSRTPAWTDPPDTPVVTGLSLEVREVLITTTHDALPDHRHLLDGDSIWPPLLSLGVGASFIGLVFHPIAFVVGSALAFLILLGWFWPEPDPRTPPTGTRVEEAAPPLSAPPAPAPLEEVAR